MSHDLQAERAQAREHLSRMVHAGQGWWPYALARAEELVRGDPVVHGGLVGEIENQIGSQGVRAARKAIAWFGGNR